MAHFPSSGCRCATVFFAAESGSEEKEKFGFEEELAAATHLLQTDSQRTPNEGGSG